MRKIKNVLASILLGPALVIGGIMALWENEGRFNYYEAAMGTIPIASSTQHMGESISYTSTLDTTIPIAGEYIKEFVFYHLVERHAEIYSWDESEDSDGHTEWRIGWYSRLDNNSHNSGLLQLLSSTTLYPPRYTLGDMDITPERIHFVDDDENISITNLTVTNKGRSVGLIRDGQYLYLAKGRADALGDERLSYEGIPNAKVASYFGVVLDGNGIGLQFEKNTGFISDMIANDGILHHLVNGEREESLDKIEADYTRVVWLTRLGGTLSIVFGFHIFLSIFTSLLYRIPLLGGVAEFGVFIVSMVLGLPIALFSILAGLLFHSLFSVALPMLAIIGGVVYFVRRSRATKQNARKMLSEKLSGYTHSQPASRPLAGQFATATDSETQTTMTGINLIERTYRQLAMVALSEGGLDKAENRMLITWGKENGVSKKRMKELFAETKASKTTTHPANQGDLELLVLMALADGEVSTQEWNTLTRFANLIGLSSLDLRNMVGDIESGELTLVI